MEKIRRLLVFPVIAGYLTLTLLAPNSAHALRSMGTENSQALREIRAGMEESAVVPTVTRVPFGDWEQLLNRWLGREGVIQKETEHLGAGEIWSRLVLAWEYIPIVEALADGDWVERQPAMQKFLYKPTMPESLYSGIDSRPLVQLVVNRYRRNDGQEVLLIERVQILRGPQELEYGEELEIRSELVEMIGEWGRENNIPVYLIRPEVMRDANPELREITIRRNYYDPVAQRNPRLWDTVRLRVIGSSFLSGDDQQDDDWFLYKGDQPGQRLGGLEEVERMTGLEFGQKYKRINLNQATSPEVEKWLGRSDIQATVMELPHIVYIYVQGVELYYATIGQLEKTLEKYRRDVVMPLLQIPEKAADWNGPPGVILKEPGASVPRNPKNLPVLETTLEGISDITPVELLVAALRDRMGLPDQGYLGALKFTDAEGRVKLALFS